MGILISHGLAVDLVGGLFGGSARKQLSYGLGRLTYAVSLLAATIVLSFILFQLVPSDPARIILGANATPSQAQALRVELGLDRPVVDQFFTYLSGLVTGNLGKSFIDGRPVAAELGEKLGLSAVLAGMASALAAAYVSSQIALSQNGTADRLFAGANRLFTTMPTMFVAVLALKWIMPHYPFNFYPGSLFEAGAWAFLLPPALVLALYPLGILGQIADREFRALDGRPFIEAARARGLSETRIKWRHMFPNALISLLSSYVTLLPILLTGSFVVEIMFSVPGLGALLMKSVLNRDLPMLQGIVIVSATFAIAIHLFIELAYPAIDPRLAGADHG